MTKLNAQTIPSQMPLQVILVGLVVAFGLGGCKLNKAERSDDKRIAGFEVSYRHSHELKGDSDVSLSGINSFAKFDLDLHTNVAFNDCNCTPISDKKSMKYLLEKDGALPQVLMPVVREEIKQNPVLQALNSIPNGPLGSIISALGVLFTTDSQLNSQVQKSLTTQVANSSPNGARSLESIDHKFNGFTTFSNTVEKDYVDALNQAATWDYIMSLDQFWTGSDPIFSDHGPQVYLSAKTFSEWEYIFGLKQRDDGSYYGGLMSPAANPTLSDLGSYDARVEGQDPGLFSGVMKINYEKNSQLTLATEVNEYWQKVDTKADMFTQGLILKASAKAFSRVRPRNRQFSKSIYDNGTTGLLPADEVHLLALAFLPGLAKSLEGTFDETSRDLLQYDKNMNIKEKADIDTLVALGIGLAKWNYELSDISDLDLDPSLRNTIAENTPLIKKVTQAVLQKMIADYYVAGDRIRSNNFFLTEDQKSLRPLKIGDALTLLKGILTLERYFPSPVVKAKIADGLHWVVGTYIRRYDALERFSAKELITLKTVLDLYAPIEEIDPTKWYRDLQELTNKLVSEIDGGSN